MLAAREIDGYRNKGNPVAASINSVLTTDQPPVVVIGTGPIGLAAAAHLVEHGIEPLVLEAGPV
ncbi:NAD(P)-binding protein, partial [Streptomyces sp. NPDC002920]